MAKLDAAAVADLLAEHGGRLALAGGADSRFKARAYERAARSLRSLSAPLEQVIAAGRLRALPGVGEALARRIVTLHETGTDPQLEAMRREAPAGLLELMRVPGLRRERALQLHGRLGIGSVEELEEACRNDRLGQAKGFGPALQRKLLQAIALMRREGGAHLIHQAEALLLAAAAELGRARPELTRIVPAGPFRRGCELVRALSLVAEHPDEAAAPTTARLAGGLALHQAPRRAYGVALLFATGAPEHVAELQAVARARGLVLTETGLTRDGRPLACPDEARVYKALGLPFIEPELREGRGEIARARDGRLPRLVREADLRGVLHSHTLASDGTATLADMAKAARARGLGYFGVSDHSQSAAYAGGLKPEAVAAQAALADGLNARMRGRFRILRGIESDILQDGALDYPDLLLRSFDFVVASVHSRFGLDERAQTERILRAVANPRTTVLGHPTGRLLLRRDGYGIDFERVLAACAEHGVAVEVNGNPHRLDLDWRWHARALELGCRLCLNPDAHSTAELGLTRWAVTMARKGGVPKEAVLNALDLEGLRDHLARRKSPSRGQRRPRGRTNSQ